MCGIAGILKPGHAETIRAIHTLNPNTGVEILIPDFQGKPDRLQQVIDAEPEVFAHNVETVPRIFREIRARRVELRQGVVAGRRTPGDAVNVAGRLFLPIWGPPSAMQK